MPRPYALWSDPLPRPGWLNMAIDCALLERAEAGGRWLRLYAWEPTLSWGRHEPAVRGDHSDRVESMGLAVVRRPTGGRAVWHAGELTYAVAAPADELGSLGAAYREIHVLIRDAVDRLGAVAELAPDGRAAGVDAGACFARPAGGEVMVRGRKVAGSAQLRRGSALLQHGSILLDDDQSVVANVTRGDAPPDGSLPLRQALGRTVSWREAATALADAVAAAWGPASAPGPGDLADILARATAWSERFRSPAWTWFGRATADATAPSC